MGTAYLWVKAFHIVFVASWFAGLFYLPRIFVNLAGVAAASHAERERLLLMATRLYRFANLLMWVALALGLWLWWGFETWRGFAHGWLDLKLVLVVGAIGYQHVCGAILGLKKGSRLHRRLVREQQIAAEAQSFTYDLTKGSDLLVLDVTARPETTPDQLERAVNHEVDRIRDEGVTADEVARAVTLIQTELIVSLQSAGDRADKLSLFATYFGDPSLVNVQADRYRAVTAEQVNAFARSRLGVGNRAGLLYVPRDTAVAEPTRELAEAGAR